MDIPGELRGLEADMTDVEMIVDYDTSLEVGAE